MGKNNNRAHSLDDDKSSKEEGMMHLIECNGDGVNGNGCVAWTSIWLPKKLPRGFNERRFLCGFCAAAEVEQMKEKLATSQQTSQPDQKLGSVLSSAQTQLSNMEGVTTSEFLASRMCQTRTPTIR